MLPCAGVLHRNCRQLSSKTVVRTVVRFELRGGRSDHQTRLSDFSAAHEPFDDRTSLSRTSRYVHFAAVFGSAFTWLTQRSAASALPMTAGDEPSLSILISAM